MFDKCKVLDVCCGDGSYSYMFFSDIAASIDAVDNDEYALKYAKKYSSRDTINYHLLDIISMPMPSSNYDFIIWNAAICYFDNHEIDLILRKFIDAINPNLRGTCWENNLQLPFTTIIHDLNNGSIKEVDYTPSRLSSASFISSLSRRNSYIFKSLFNMVLSFSDVHNAFKIFANGGYMVGNSQHVKRIIVIYETEFRRYMLEE